MIKSLIARAYGQMINLFLAYFLQYVIITCVAKALQDQIQKKYPEKYENGDITVKSFNDIIQFCFQVGQFFSRSSLKFVKIKQVTILTIVTLINFAVLFVNAKLLFFDSIYAIGAMVFFAGLMGGASYVNVLHNIRELKTLNQSEKESAMSLTLLFNDTGILSAATFTLIVSNTFLKVDGIND